MANLLEDLTVVIPTFSRLPFLRRTLDFAQNFSFKVVVVDGSPNAQCLESLYPSVRHIRAEVSLVKRIELALPFVLTNYVALWGDDEFWVPTMLAKAVKFLDQNGEYVACLGQAIEFDKSPHLTMRPIYPGLRGLDLSLELRDQRLLDRMRNYTWGGLWGVARTTAWKRAWGVPIHKEFEAYGATEIQFEAAMAWQGKILSLNEVGWFRSNENPPITDSGDISLSDSFPRFHSWWPGISGDTREEFLQTFGVALTLSDSDKVDFQFALDAYCFAIESRGTGNALVQLPWLEKHIRKFARRALSLQKHRRIQANPEISLDELLSSCNSETARLEIQQIIECVVKS